jgi:hypothetical protein
MTTKLTYTLEDINNIANNGFEFQFSENTMNIITELSKQVGSTYYVKTPNFQNKSIIINKDLKKKKNKATEIYNDCEWNILKLNHDNKQYIKNDLENHIDTMRSCLNKLSDKNYNETVINICKIMNELEIIDFNNNNNETIQSISKIIFEIASTNRFYSKIYAELYGELSYKYSVMMNVFKNNFDEFTLLFNNIEYIDPEIDYNLFIKTNEINEKRKSLACFYFNLMLNKIITKSQVIEIIKLLLEQVYSYIFIENKKKEVEELTEIIFILYKPNFYEEQLLTTYLINGQSIVTILNIIAKSKITDFKSLTSKALFKYMDMIEI